MSNEIAVESQLEHLFNRIGINTKDITHNPNTGRWVVEPQVEGSDERFREYKGEIGGAEPVDYALDFSAVRVVLPEIDGAEIPAGTVRIDNTDSYRLLLEIE